MLLGTHFNNLKGEKIKGATNGGIEMGKWYLVEMTTL